MSTAMDQKAYLQRYLAGPSNDKKKKKKKAVKGKGFKIIDDDLDLSKLRPLDGDELDILNEGEDAPQIAGIIDERPDELKKLDYETSTKWKVINQDDGFNSKISVQEVKRDKKETKKENEITFGKMYSDSEDEKDNDSDLSPPRKKQSMKNERQRSDSDFSPPRKDKSNKSDLSPPRRSSLQNNNSRSKQESFRNTSNALSNKKYRKDSDSDVSPPRKKEKTRSNGSDLSPRKSCSYNDNERHKRSRHSKVDSLPNKKNGDASRSKYENDASPARKKDKSSSRKNYNSDLSPPRKSRYEKKHKSKQDSDSDISPPRKKDKLDSTKSNCDSDLSPPRKVRYDKKHKSRADSDSDASPPRKKDKSDSKKYRNDSDLSPPRNNKSKERRKPSRWGDYDESYKNLQQQSDSPSRRSSKSPESYRHKKSKSEKTDDLSKSSRNRSDKSKYQKTKYDSDVSKNSKDRSDTNKYQNSDSDLSPPRKIQKGDNKKMEKTLDGKMAGLQDARQLKDENVAFRKREEDAFRNMTDEMSGRNAQAVSRKGKRETSEDKQKQREKAERQKELDEKYKKWSKGLKQIEAQEAAVNDFLHESSKPLARYKDDRDLESKLKDIEREGDPMLKYIKDKKRERGELGPEKPTYKGNFPPNRFNIRPGYRWDGVDRSNGYEKKFFENKSKRKAQEEEAYKWSIEDL